MTGNRRGPIGTTVPSPLQNRVLILLAEDLPRRQIADRLDVTEGTVRSALKELGRKFGVPPHRNDIVAAAYRAGYIPAAPVCRHCGQTLAAADIESGGTR